MRSQNPVLCPVPKQFQSLLYIVALKDVEILNDELVLLGPPYSQSVLLGVLLRAFLVQGAHVQQVVHLLVVDLQKRDEDGVVLGGVFGFELFHLSE